MTPFRKILQFFSERIDDDNDACVVSKFHANRLLRYGISGRCFFGKKLRFFWAISDMINRGRPKFPGKRPI